jgi:ABC-type lipoprotein release transport system permease subunit
MDEPLLREIRDLLQEQNRLIGEIRAQNEAMAARNAEHMAKAEEMAHRTWTQNTAALGSTKSLKIGVWLFMLALILLFAIPSLISWR